MASIVGIGRLGMGALTAALAFVCVTVASVEAASPAFSLTPLAGPGGQLDSVVVQGLNLRGDIAGSYIVPGSEALHAFVSPAGGVATDLGTLGGDNSSGAAISARGHVAGSSQLASFGGQHPFLWSAAGGMVDLGQLPGALDCFANAIDARDDVAGFCDASDFTQQAFVWTRAAGMAALGTLPGQTMSIAFALDSSGVVAGISGSSVFTWDATDGMRALPSRAGWQFTRVGEIRDSGEVVATALVDGTHEHAVLFRGGNWKDLGTLPGGTDSSGGDVNGSGQAAGFSFDASGDPHAFVWDRQHGMQDLNRLVPANSGVDLSDAVSIDDYGRIVALAGGGFAKANGVRSFLLSPCTY